MQLVRVDESLKILKSDFDLCPIHHQIETRVEAHILVAFLGYCLTMTPWMTLSSQQPPRIQDGTVEMATAADHPKM